MKILDSQKVINFLNMKWGGAVCPLCGGREWNITDRTFELREYNEGNLVVGGAIVPIIPVTCSNCGNTVFINALSTDLLKE